MKNLKISILAVATVAALGTGIAPANAAQLGGQIGMFTSLLGGIGGVDPGLIAALDTVNTYLPMVDAIANGHMPSTQDILAVAPNGLDFQIGGYKLGIGQNGYSCKAVDVNGNINPDDTLCDKAAAAVTAFSDKNTSMSTAKLATLALKLAGANLAIAQSNTANAQAATAANQAIKKNGEKSQQAVATAVTENANAVSTFQRQKVTNDTLAQTANSLLITSTELNRLNGQVQTANKVSGAMLSIETDRVNRERYEADLQDADRNKTAANSRKARGITAALGQF